MGCHFAEHQARPYTGSQRMNSLFVGFALSFVQVIPAFGSEDDDLRCLFANGVIDHGAMFQDLQSRLHTLVTQVCHNQSFTSRSLVIFACPKIASLRVRHRSRRLTAPASCQCCWRATQAAAKLRWLPTWSAVYLNAAKQTKASMNVQS